MNTKKIASTYIVIIVYRNSSKCFTCSYFSNLRNRGKGRLSNLPSVTWRVKGGSGILTQAIWLQTLPLLSTVVDLREFSLLSLSD